MKRHLILVLEDAAERTMWLRTVFLGTSHQVMACAEVSLFVATAKTRRDELALVIFDHDLGHQPIRDGETVWASLPNYDADGKTGADAAQQLEPVECQALVWSWNPEGARRIAHTLYSEKKATKVRRRPFEKSTEFAAYITAMLTE